MRSFLMTSLAAGLALSASVCTLSVALAQPNDVRTATTPVGQVPVVPAVVAPAVVAPAAVVEQTTVAPAAVVAAPPADVALAGQVLRTKQVDIRGTNEKVL